MKSLIGKIWNRLLPSSEGELTGNIIRGKNCTIINSRIFVGEHARLVMNDDVKLENCVIRIDKGTCEIGQASQLEVNIAIENGELHIGHHTLLRGEVCVRYGGKCTIGDYTGIMSGTEIRCDESVQIGSYCMISYECMIYDTNTHCNYPADIRRKKTESDYPLIGKETEKPDTSPVVIGDDCWLGKRATILKSVSVGNGSTVAACAVLTHSMASQHLAFGNPAQARPKKSIEPAP